MCLAQMLHEGLVKNGEAFNFGPRAEQTKTVLQLVKDLAQNWGLNPEDSVQITGEVPFEEAKLLKLNCDKSLAYLQWHSVLNYKETVEMITDWYRCFYGSVSDLFEMTEQQIDHYEQEAINQAINWTN